MQTNSMNSIQKPWLTFRYSFRTETSARIKQSILFIQCSFETDGETIDGIDGLHNDIDSFRPSMLTQSNNQANILFGVKIENLIGSKQHFYQHKECCTKDNVCIMPLFEWITRNIMRESPESTTTWIHSGNEAQQEKPTPYNCFSIFTLV